MELSEVEYRQIGPLHWLVACKPPGTSQESAFLGKRVMNHDQSHPPNTKNTTIWEWFLPPIYGDIGVHLMVYPWVISPLG